MKKALLLLCFLLILIPCMAQAAEISRLYVWDGNKTVGEDGSMPSTAILWTNRGNKQYLYLPSGVDASNLFVHFTGGAKSFTCNGQTVYNDTVTDVFVPGTTVTVKCGKQVLSVTVYQSSSLPTVYINTQSGSLTKLSESTKVTETGSWYIADESGLKLYEDAFEYIRLRGNYSFYVPKKSFHIKLTESAKILGMPKSKTWVLIAGYRDNSMIRNAISLDIAAAAGLEYTSEYRFTDVYVNRLYYGTYLLCEKVQQGKNRVNITDLEKATQAVNTKELSAYAKDGERAYQKNSIKYSAIPNDPDDITGGYLLEVELSDRYSGASSGFVTSRGQTVLIKSPEYASKTQAAYISSLVQSFENAISAEDGIDPVTGKHFFEIADKDSLVAKYLIEEISENYDANKSSFYFYKYKDSVSEKLYFGPVWDYDAAYGIYTSRNHGMFSIDPEALYVATDNEKNYFWFPKLYSHPEFVEAVKEAYRTTFRPLLEVLLGDSDSDTGLQSLTAYQAELTDAATMNFARWATFNSKDFPAKTGATYEENIEYLRTFLTKRMAFLDSIWLDGE